MFYIWKFDYLKTIVSLKLLFRNIKIVKVGNLKNVCTTTYVHNITTYLQQQEHVQNTTCTKYTHG